MEIRKIATYHGPFGSKFGVPRQSGLVQGIEGRIVFEPEFRSTDAVRGLEGFDYLWLVWEFSENREHGKSAEKCNSEVGAEGNCSHAAACDSGSVDGESGHDAAAAGIGGRADEWHCGGKTGQDAALPPIPAAAASWPDSPSTEPLSQAAA